MDNAHDLKLVLASRAPIVVVETHDEARFLRLMRRVAREAAAGDYRPLFRWSVTAGLGRLDIDLPPQLHNAEPDAVLRHIRGVDKDGIYVLLDFHPWLSDPVNVRLIKDIALDDRARRTLVLVSHQLPLPPELERLAARFTMALPDDRERRRIVRDIAREWAEAHKGRVTANPEALDRLVTALGGLTHADTERLARNAIYDDGAITHSDVPALMRARCELVAGDGLLAYEFETADFDDVAGLARLKEWLVLRQPAMMTGASRLPPPRGVLLIGVQGCGKSLAARAAAGVFALPLLRLDFGVLYNKYHGETERNLRDALAQAEALSPCVLWIDELEKGLATGDGDSGTSRRVLGTFLTWLAEREGKVFVVATANDISALPPELVRKGRFDEIFFVDLPTAAVRGEIFRIHLAARGESPAEFDMSKLVAASRDFSGAEIEQAVVAALYVAHAAGEELADRHLLEELDRTRPLAVVMAERVAALRDWAGQRTVPADA